MAPPRRSDIDWLRVLATYLVLVFHVTKVFDPFPFYHVKNAETSQALGIAAGFVHQWHMPLFFLLAGWSAFFSLSGRGVRSMLAERVRRLGVPLLFGIVFLCPVIKYLELSGGQSLHFHGLATVKGFHENFLEFLPTFFTRLDRFTWAHLWFLAYLLAFTALLAPVLRALHDRKEALRWKPRALHVYLPIIPLALIQVSLRERYPGIQNLVNDWANVGFYGLCFAIGFLLARSPVLEETVHAEWRRALVVGTAAMLALWLSVSQPVPPVKIVLALTAVGGWCFVVGWLGAARRFLGTSNRALAWLSESAMPVYVLHQIVVVLIAHQIVALRAGIGVKFALLLVLGLGATAGLYQVAIRPFGSMRFFFGMKPRSLRELQAARSGQAPTPIAPLSVTVARARGERG